MHMRERLCPASELQGPTERAFLIGTVGRLQYGVIHLFNRTGTVALMLCPVLLCLIYQMFILSLDRLG